MEVDVTANENSSKPIEVKQPKLRRSKRISLWKNTPKKALTPKSPKLRRKSSGQQCEPSVSKSGTHTSSNSTTVSSEQLLKELLRIKEECRIMNEAYEAIEKMECDPLPKPGPLPRKNDPLPLNCDHLSSNQIKEYFAKHVAELEDVHKGSAQNARHDFYHENPMKRETLWFNNSTGVFPPKALQQMATLCRMHFEPQGTTYDNFRYNFAVLLPELCLLIFMNEHGMTRSEAIDKLNTQPAVERE